MTNARILIIDGHPDASRERFVHALAAAYRDGATRAGHEVRSVRVADLEFPWLRSAEEFEQGVTPPAILRAQDDLRWCTHLVLLYPLWLGSMPALLKAFLEQTLRPGFAFSYRARGLPNKLMRGRSVRVVVTMGMPPLFYRLIFGAHSLKSLERNILKFVGFHPVRATLIGQLGKQPTRATLRAIEMLKTLGARAR